MSGGLWSWTKEWPLCVAPKQFNLLRFGNSFQMQSFASYYGSLLWLCNLLAFLLWFAAARCTTLSAIKRPHATSLSEDWYLKWNKKSNTFSWPHITESDSASFNEVLSESNVASIPEWKYTVGIQHYYIIWEGSLIPHFEVFSCDRIVQKIGHI